MAPATKGKTEIVYHNGSKNLQGIFKLSWTKMDIIKALPSRERLDKLCHEDMASE
jgi:hypothetical protein